MKVTLFGSTGKTGRLVLGQTLAEGHTVTVLIRDHNKLQINHSNLSIVIGDVFDFKAVKKAIKGNDAVLCMLGALPGNKEMVRAHGTKNIILAMEETNVRRLICQSAVGVSDSKKMLPFHYKYLLIPLLLRHVFADHEKQEEYIKTSSLDWTIVRPSVLTDKKKQGSIQICFPGDKVSLDYTITRADVADFMVNQLTDQQFLRRSPCISS